MRIPIPAAGEATPIPGTLLLTLESLASPLLFPPGAVWWALLAVAGTALCWVPFLRGVTTSVRRMEQVTTRIADGDFDSPLEVSRQDELGRLATAIDQMSSRLGHLLASQKRFLGDAAHELRSPLARMRVAQELLAQRVGQDDRRYLRDLEEDLEVMVGLTDGLLALARSEAGVGAVRLGPVNVAEGVTRAIEAECRDGVAIEVEIPAETTVCADVELFVRAVGNVLRNAVRYAGDAGPIRVTALPESDGVAVVVSDCGPGVPPAALQHLCTPFYRLESSRGRAHGGTGLGLAIVQRAVEQCGGEVRCRNRAPSGLEVTLTWPAAASLPPPIRSAR